jgi:hypothetical protein
MNNINRHSIPVFKSLRHSKTLEKGKHVIVEMFEATTRGEHLFKVRHAHSPDNLVVS